MPRQVKIEIMAKVTTTVTLAEGETLKDLKARDVDIYLHDAGEDGSFSKSDLGADSYMIMVLPE